METNFDYYRRRAAEELAAADNAPNEAIAAVHRSLADRYRTLSGEPHLAVAAQRLPGVPS